jgi:tRNA-Thr(GGU) m(6)t(6)A37 methyltransferase TsaA
MDQKIELKPIGTVRNEMKKHPPASKMGCWAQMVSEIWVDQEYAEALEGLEDFSHITVIYWMHRMGPVTSLKRQPLGRADMPQVGLFATRSPRRINPLGISVIRLLERQDSRLMVRGLDALDGSPVIDIKGYSPPLMPHERPRLPMWIRKIRAEMRAERSG